MAVRDRYGVHREIFDIFRYPNHWKFHREIYLFYNLTDFNFNQNISKQIKDSLEEDNILLLGDFNAHIELIGYQILSKNLEQLLNILDICNFMMINLDGNKTIGAVT